MLQSGRHRVPLSRAAAFAVAFVDVLRTPDADLATAATAAVQGWEFRATELNCVPVDTTMNVTLNFSLTQ